MVVFEQETQCKKNGSWKRGISQCFEGNTTNDLCVVIKKY